MKRTLIAIACALAFALPTANAGASTLALDFGDAYYVGRIVDGIPSSEALEAVYITYLLRLAPGDPQIQLPGGSPPEGELYDRLGSSLMLPLPPLVTAGVKDESGGSIIWVSGVGYILAKYDQANPGAGAYVWYVGGLVGYVSVPTHSPSTLDDKGKEVRYGLGHTTSFGVPDGGATLMLLGATLFGLGVLRRRFGA
jgi:hypothetical protein